MPNIELLDQALDDIEQQRFLWRQDVWISLTPEAFSRAKHARPESDPPCGTSMCLAGHIAWQAGYRPWSRCTTRWGHPDTLGVVGWVDVIAKDLLGLNSDQAGWLFGGGNTFEDLRHIRNEIARGVTLS